MKQREEDIFNRALQDKINRLDKKLQSYLLHHKEREERFNKLEQKVYITLTRDQKIGKLQGQLEAMEVLYRNLKALGTISPSQLEEVRDKITEMKARLSDLEKQESKESEPDVEHLPPRDFWPRKMKQDQSSLPKPSADPKSFSDELAPEQRPKQITIPRPIKMPLGFPGPAPPPPKNT